jgi:hypothetical protein
MRKHFLIGIEFQFYKIKSTLEIGYNNLELQCTGNERSLKDAFQFFGEGV